MLSPYISVIWVREAEAHGAGLRIGPGFYAENTVNNPRYSSGLKSSSP
jgi:hypothetical protein